MKDRENYDLLKVPDEIIIKELRIELGKANSRVQELEDKLEAHSSGKIHELIKSLKGTIKALVEEKKSDKYYQLYQEQRERNDRLTQSNSDLIGKILILQTKNEKEHAQLLADKMNLMQEMHAFAHIRNEGWEADWNNSMMDKHGLFTEEKVVNVGLSIFHNGFIFGIAVKSEEIAKEMLEEFGERIESIYNKQY